jgi:hypothetical protein
MMILTTLLFACTPTPAEDPVDPVDSDVPSESEVLTFYNTNDGDLEGHTPRGFQGQGAGMFVGDNLNSGFPEGDGVQMFLSMDISSDEDWDAHSATLSSTHFETQGDPYTDLGELVAEEIVFDAFSSALWDADVVAGGLECVFATDDDGPYSCDVTDAVQAALDEGRDLVQFRFRLDLAGDSDGMQDMVMFHKGDTNATAKRLFTLEVEAR